jgi:hypothetical protein
MTLRDTFRLNNSWPSRAPGRFTDASVLHGDFWPEEESIEDFLAALHAWRGHKRSDSRM